MRDIIKEEKIKEIFKEAADLYISMVRCVKGFSRKKRTNKIIGNMLYATADWIDLQFQKEEQMIQHRLSLDEQDYIEPEVWRVKYDELEKRFVLDE